MDEPIQTVTEDPERASPSHSRSRVPKERAGRRPSLPTPFSGGDEASAAADGGDMYFDVVENGDWDILDTPREPSAAAVADSVSRTRPSITTLPIPEATTDVDEDHHEASAQDRGSSRIMQVLRGARFFRGQDTPSNTSPTSGSWLRAGISSYGLSPRRPLPADVPESMMPAAAAAASAGERNGEAWVVEPLDSGEVVGGRPARRGGGQAGRTGDLGEADGAGTRCPLTNERDKASLKACVALSKEKEFYRFVDPSSCSERSMATGSKREVEALKRACGALHREGDEPGGPAVVAREQEMDTLEQFLKGAYHQDGHGCLYVWGPPGSGKTLCVTRAVEGVTGSKPRLINAMDDGAFTAILAQLADKVDLNPKAKQQLKAAKNQSAMYEILKQRIHAKRKTCVVVLDEFDRIATQEVMRSGTVQHNLHAQLFRLATEPKSKLILIGISNAPLGSLKGKLEPHLHPQVLEFKEYTSAQLQQIVESRIDKQAPPPPPPPPDPTDTHMASPDDPPVRAGRRNKRKNSRISTSAREGDQDGPKRLKDEAGVGRAVKATHTHNKGEGEGEADEEGKEFEERTGGGRGGVRMTATSRNAVALMCKKAAIQHKGDARKTLGMARTALGARIENLSQELQQPNPRSSSVALASPSRRSSRRRGSPGPAAPAAAAGASADGGGAGATVQIGMAEVAAAARAGRESRVSIPSLDRSMHILLLAALQLSKKSTTGTFTGQQFMDEHRRVLRWCFMDEYGGAANFWDTVQNTQGYGLIGVHGPRKTKTAHCYGPGAIKNRYSVQDIPGGEVDSTIALLKQLIFPTDTQMTDSQQS
ncbi:unnamed protein product [Vitrella brassicaformis CCMP3155]|uniref:AAA+ ATPase domain-containing protein n=1 Tax=Vitrella brassicaformis (strain CCMP3155) TaxID=1169540 RepID=A0A0G4EJY1_VITBC|nr:unnamed protein product [Vitrella brassicaformis CCMP3155]|eukprot:CEL97057.1 unnamed protein product [Vitrella brassicaformis CCMP3155]